MNWIYYLLEANLYLSVFYLAYYLILKRETYYQINRAYLLITSLLAFFIPLVQLGFLKSLPNLQSSIVIKATTPFAHGNTAKIQVINNLMPHNYLPAIYLTVVCLLFINLAVKIYKLVRLAYQYKNTESGFYKLVEITGTHNAFSFFNYLFISSELASKQTIIQHELIHIRQKHSWDILFTELFKIINWFNPVVYLLQNSIKELHEFIADSETVAKGYDMDVYTNFLVSNAYGVNNNVLTNSFFNKNLLKKRIIMLHQKRSGKSARLKYLLAMPIVFGLLCLSTLSFSKNYGLIEVLPINKANMLNKVNDQSEGNMMKPLGTKSNLRPPTNPLDSFYKYIAKTIQYPESARKNLIAGRVILNFNVTDGKITDVKVVRNLDADIEAASLQAINSFSGPLNVNTANYSLSISFALKDIQGNWVGHSSYSNSTATNKTAVLPTTKSPRDRASYMLDEIVITALAE